MRTMQRLAVSVAFLVSAALGRASHLEDNGASTQTLPQCGSDETVVQFLHIQDVSYSSTDNRDALIDGIPQFTNDLASLFFRRETGLIKFSDKGIRPFGDPNGDVCYRVNRRFRDQGYRNALRNLEMLSGLDWKESQLEAIYRALEDSTLGWLPPVDPESGKAVLRVMAIVTDSLPHVRGTRPELPVDSTRSCIRTDYPSVQQVSELLDSFDTHLFVMSTGDIFEEWTELMAGVPKAKVLRQQDFADLPVSMMQLLCDPI